MREEDAFVDGLQGLEIGENYKSKLGKKSSNDDVDDADVDSEEKEVEIPTLKVCMELVPL